MTWDKPLSALDFKHFHLHKQAQLRLPRWLNKLLWCHIGHFNMCCMNMSHTSAAAAHTPSLHRISFPGKAASMSDIYFEGSTQLHGVCIIHNRDAEVGRLQKLLKKLSVLQDFTPCIKKNK